MNISLATYRLDGDLIVRENTDGAPPDFQELFQTKVGLGIEVATHFVGIDSSLGKADAPLVFETIIFGGKHHHYTRRSARYDIAKFVHYKAVTMAEDSLPAWRRWFKWLI